MSSYRGTADRRSRAKALLGVLIVHAGLAALIVSGLGVRTVTQAVDRLRTFDIAPEAPPAPDPPPELRPKERSAPEDEPAPANIESQPTPVVAPTPPIPLPLEQRINTSDIRGPEGTDRSAGASIVPGSGTGAGGQGSGFGGGGTGGSGSGSGSGFTPARLLNRIPDRDYRRIAGNRLARGSAAITLKVNPDGTASNCRIARSSGDSTVDQALCQIAVQRLRFRPARDPAGRPVAQDLTYNPTWRPD